MSESVVETRDMAAQDEEEDVFNDTVLPIPKRKPSGSDTGTGICHFPFFAARFTVGFVRQSALEFLLSKGGPSVVVSLRSRRSHDVFL